MDMKKSMWSIWVVSLSGVLFSGTLSYSELFKRQCLMGGCTYLGSLPSCVYGFIAFCILLAISSAALYTNQGSKSINNKR
jgi:hypothetical protein